MCCIVKESNGFFFNSEIGIMVLSHADYSPESAIEKHFSWKDLIVEENHETEMEK